MRDTKYRALVETFKGNVLDGKYGNGNPFPSVRARIGSTARVARPRARKGGRPPEKEVRRFQN